jgi:hypothetical protein
MNNDLLIFLTKPEFKPNIKSAHFEMPQDRYVYFNEKKMLEIFCSKEKM